MKDATHIEVHYLNKRTGQSVRLWQPIRAGISWVLILNIFAAGFVVGAAVGVAAYRHGRTIGAEGN